MKADQAWKAAVGQLQIEMPKAAFDIWVRDAEFISYEDGSFIIGVSNAYALDWLNSRLLSTVTRLLTGIMNRTVEVRFVLWQESNEDNKKGEVFFPLEEPTKLATNQSLNPRYSFESFIIGANNRLAHAASLAVAEKPAKVYNPLFIYGDVGMGKTHLLHALGSQCHSDGLNVLYVSSEEFTNDLVSAIRTHTTHIFREKYRHLDVLLIDDIQFIVGKESTQEEFFHTFNSLHARNKQIVISSDRPPKAMISLEKRLCSRFEWGLIADIQRPDFETRLAILEAKNGNNQIPEDVLELIAMRIQSNIRELEGALTRVSALSDHNGLSLTSHVVESALEDMLPIYKEAQPDRVIQLVAETFGVSVDDLLGRSRSRHIAFPRQVAMYLLREVSELSLPQIGAHLGGRDHTTIMYGWEKISALIQKDTTLKSKVLSINEEINSSSRTLVNKDNY